MSVVLYSRLKITGNGFGLAAGGDLEAPTFNLPQM